jgi:hypothetical protein
MLVHVPVMMARWLGGVMGLVGVFTFLALVL